MGALHMHHVEDLEQWSVNFEGDNGIKLLYFRLS